MKKFALLRFLLTNLFLRKMAGTTSMALTLLMVLLSIAHKILRRGATYAEMPRVVWLCIKMIRGARSGSGLPRFIKLVANI